MLISGSQPREGGWEDELRSGQPRNSIAITSGMVGCGKSTMAAFLAQDARVQTHFEHGVVWLSFGRERTGEDALRALADSLRRLADSLRLPLDTLPALGEQDAGKLQAAISQWLQGKQLLVVLDDVWMEEEQVELFQELRGGLTLLLTTRNHELAAAKTTKVDRPTQVPAFSGDEAMTFLSAQLQRRGLQPSEEPQAVAELMDMCHGNPALLQAVAALCEQKSIVGALDELQQGMQTVFSIESSRVRESKPRTPPLDSSFGDSEYGTMAEAMEQTLAFLEHKSRGLHERCLMLAIFKPDAEIQLSAIRDLWSLGEEDARKETALLQKMNVATLSPADGTLLLIGIWGDFMRNTNSTIAVRYPALAPNGKHYGGHLYLSVKEALGSTLERVSKRLTPLLHGIYVSAARARFPAWELNAEDVVLLFNGARRDKTETLRHALDEAVVQHGAQAVAQPLATHPEVRMVLSVIITNRKLPMAALQARVPPDQVHQMVRAGKLRFTKPTGAEPLTDNPKDPCPVCLCDMRGIDGCLLPCGHALHSDCIANWANAAEVPSCPLCRKLCE